MYDIHVAEKLHVLISQKQDLQLYTAIKHRHSCRDLIPDINNVHYRVWLNTC